MQDQANWLLYSLSDAAQQLGRVSVWTLRKHAALGTLNVTRIGKRVLVSATELSRVQRDGLPPLRSPKA